MTVNALEAPCGIHCGFCPLNLALTREDVRSELAGRLNMPPEEVGCAGCRSIEGRCPVIGEPCATWLCAREKGVEFCSDCAEFPCLRLMPCADRAGRLPHNIKIYSLALRKAKGPEEWAKAIKDVYDLYFHSRMIIGRGPSARD
jgi:hypothetical protein